MTIIGSTRLQPYVIAISFSISASCRRGGVILEIASGSGEHVVHLRKFRVSFSNLRSKPDTCAARPPPTNLPASVGVIANTERSYPSNARLSSTKRIKHLEAGRRAIHASRCPRFEAKRARLASSGKVTRNRDKDIPLRSAHSRTDAPRLQKSNPE